MEKVRLGDVATFVNGYAFKPSDWSTEGLEIIRIQNLTKSGASSNYYSGNLPEKYKIRKGNILISWSATLDIFVWDGNDAWLNQHIFKVVFDKIEINEKYFIYAIKKILGYMRSQVHGATMQHITKGKFDNLEIPLPPLDAQKRIATLLDTADSLRQKDKALLQKYDALAQSLFLELFGDPVRNEKGWEKTTIREICKNVKYGTSSKATIDGEFPYLRMNNITYSGYMDFTDLKYIDVDKNDYRKYSVKKGDILFNRTNSKELVGKTGLITNDEEYIIAGYLIKVEVNEKANPYFLWAFLNSKSSKQYLRNLCKSIVGMANINAQELQGIEIYLPPIKLQNQFAEQIQLIEKQKELVQENLAKSEGLFLGLLGESFG